MPENVIASIARKLGGSAMLGMEVRSQGDLARLVQERIPLGSLGCLVRAGLSESEVARFVLPARTRRHRAARAEPLTVEESDRAVRLARIQALAEETFGDAAKANRWLRRDLAELGGKAPLDVAQTEAGARVVETILAKIAWGAAA
jgi:putative toxin-antitoxin system antitoxin component (TIGR02293 family)